MNADTLAPSPSDVAVDPEAPQMSAAQTLIGVFTEPKKTFGSLREKPRILAPVLVLLLFQLIFGLVLAQSGVMKNDAVAKMEAKNAPQDKDVTVLTQDGAPQLTADQIVANSDANIERIKKELNLTPDQEKHWNAFNSAMHYLGHNGADRLKLRVARAQRDPPDDIIEQMRNEAQFLNDRAVDQRNVADAAEPLFLSLDDKQKQIFINEMVRLSHERGLD